MIRIPDYEKEAITIILNKGVIGYGVLRSKISVLNNRAYNRLIKSLMSKQLIRKHKLTYVGTAHHDTTNRIFLTLTIKGIKYILSED